MPLFDTEQCAASIMGSPLREIIDRYDRKISYRKTAGLITVCAGGGSFYFLVLPLPLIIIAAGIIILVCNGRSRRNFFRTVIIPETFKLAAPEFKYSPESGISRTKFLASGLFNDFDRYNSEDKLSGTIGKTKFAAAEVHIEKMHKTKNGKYYSTIFRGVVFTADFNKHLNSRTVILPDIAERCFGKLIGNFFQQMNFTRGALVKLENPDFEKYFSVYSCDQIEARYVLTPHMMEQLTLMRQQNNAPMYLVFQDDSIFIAISKPSGWLEPPFFGKLARIQVFEKLLIELEEVISIIDDLDLNTRIWTKQ